MMKYLTAGESHGELLTGILDGFPAGVPVPELFVQEQLRRRRIAPGRSTRQQTENDDVKITGGVYEGRTTGAPLSVLIKNSSRKKPEPSGIIRPCHADYGGMVKYGLEDASLVRERASARETVVRTALFAFPLYMCGISGIRISSEIISLGGKSLRPCDNRPAEKAEKIIADAKAKGDTAGGEFVLKISGVPAGLGSYSQGFRRLFTEYAEELGAIPAVKGISCGGADIADIPGSVMNSAPECTGGIDGGISNGRDIIIRCVVKPVPGTAVTVRTSDYITGAAAEICSTTSDITAVYAAAVTAEGAAAFVTLNAILEKFGGDSLDEISSRLSVWRQRHGNVISVSGEENRLK